MRRSFYGNRRAARAHAALTVLTYVVCGLTLTAHIALADHHCEFHCHDHGLTPTATLAADAHCDFDHHHVEEHHEEAVKPTLSTDDLAPAAAPTAPLDLDDGGRGATLAPDADPAPLHRPAPPAPARAPPAS